MKSVSEKKKQQMDKWQGCYEEGWGGLIVPEAFAHPAKMAYGLTRRIFKHALSEGWIKPGDIVCDPFGGIGSTGIVGAHFGLQVVCVELEEKFCRLAKGFDCPGLTKKEWVRWYGRYDRNGDVCPVCQGKAHTWYEKDSGTIPFQKPHHFTGNFELHKKSIEAFAHFGQPLYPVIIQGDSRKLCELLSSVLSTVEGVAGADLIVSSPPYVNQNVGNDDADNEIRRIKEKIKSGVSMGREHQRLAKKGKFSPHAMAALKGYGQTPGNLGNLKPGQVDAVISSPPYAETLKGDGTQKETAAESRAKRRTGSGSLGQSQRTQGYGSKGNLGNLKPGTIENHKSQIVNQIDAIVSSPPWEGTTQSNQNPNDMTAGKAKWKNGSDSAARVKQDYANMDSEGQLGNLRPGKADMIVSSPPFEGCLHGADGKVSKAAQGIGRSYGGNRGRINYNYGKSDGQLGNEQGQTFWEASKIIVEQCYQILRPGGHAIWVVKDFVRKGKKVDFTGDWRRLCESAGFATLHEHHAMLVKEERKKSLFGHEIVNRKERKSFFRRLAEQKGSPAIDYETVLCMRK